jgi:hypothetical protein
MTKTYSLYEAATGLFTGKRLHCDEDELLTMKLPIGTMAVEGAFDPATQRLEPKTGTVVAYAPPEAFSPEGRRAAVLKQIQELESGQSRAIREATLGDAAALKRLQEIDAAISLLRAELELI